MKRMTTILGLLVALLLLAACAPAGSEPISEEASTGDVEVLVYASPL